MELDKLWTLAYELHLFSPNQGCCLPVKTSGNNATNFHQSTWLLENAWLLSYKHPQQTNKNSIHFMLNSIENLIGKKQTLVNPLIPMSDQDSISPYNINTISTR